MTKTVNNLQEVGQVKNTLTNAVFSFAKNGVMDAGSTALSRLPKIHNSEMTIETAASKVAQSGTKSFVTGAADTVVRLEIIQSPHLYI